MKKYLIILVSIIVIGTILSASTCTTPTVTINASGTDFNVKVTDGKACLDFKKSFKTDDITAILDSLLNGIGGEENGLHLELERDSVTGIITLTGGGCANIKQEPS